MLNIVKLCSVQLNKTVVVYVYICKAILFVISSVSEILFFVKNKEMLAYPEKMY